MGIDLTDFANTIEGANKEHFGDIDCATEKVFIEAKNTVDGAKIKQIRKYVNTSNEKFINIKQKKVALYIDEPMGELSGRDAEKINTIKEAGVKVVNSLEELREVIQSWEHPDLY